MKQSRLTGAISLSLAQAVVLMLGYVTHLWIGRVLGPAAYGVYGIVLSIQTIVGLLITLGVPAAASRFVAQREQSAQPILKQLLLVQMGVAATIAIGTVIISPLITRLLRDASLMPYLWVVAAVVFFQAFYPIYVQFLSGIHRFNRQASLTALYAVAKLAGAIILIYSFGVFGALIGFAVGGIAAAIIGFIWTRGIGGQEPYRIPNKELLSFAGSYVLMMFGLQILMSLDLFMVKSMIGDDVSTGYYNAAVTLSRIPYFLLQGLSFILLPSISALTKTGESHDKAASFVRDVIRYLIALILPSIALAAATSRELVSLFYSRTFAPAAPLLTVLIVGLGALAFFLLLANLVAGAGKTKIPMYLAGGMIGISFVSGLFLISHHGLIGAAWQTTIASTIGFVILAWYTFRTFRIPLPVRTTINVIIASTVAVLPTYIWKVGNFMLPIQYILLGIVYIVCLLILKEITPADRGRLQSIHPLVARLLSWI